jgi:uncharacterized protein (UPF0548 family)
VSGATGRVHRLRPFEADRLREEPLTYEPVGGTAAPSLPAGFHHLAERFVVGSGEATFARAADALEAWRMHAGAGLRVTASSARVAEGEVVRLRLGPLVIPCRVVWVRDDPDARGFGYGTLPGHPESGEEAFVVARERDEVVLTISAYSRPGRLLTRLGGPVARWGQRAMVRRYARTLRRLSAPRADGTGR